MAKAVMSRTPALAQRVSKRRCIGYGYFSAYVLPVPGGYVCVSFEVGSDPVASSDAIRRAIGRHLA